MTHLYFEITPEPLFSRHFSAPNNLPGDWAKAVQTLKRCDKSSSLDFF